MKTLSDKIEKTNEETILEYEIPEDEQEWIYAKNVKQFIKDLKEEFYNECRHDTPYHSSPHIIEVIDKLAGDKLIKEQK